MRMAHAAELAQRKALAIGLQLLLALFVIAASSQALRGGFVGLGHGAMAFHVGPGMGIERRRGALCLGVRLGFRVVVVVVVVMCLGCCGQEDSGQDQGNGAQRCKGHAKS